MACLKKASGARYMDTQVRACGGHRAVLETVALDTPAIATLSAIVSVRWRAGSVPRPRHNFGWQAGYNAACTLLDLPELPTAIFTGNDTQAIGVYNALHARGLHVPDDMSVINFDDVPFAALVNPALTTIRQPMKEMGTLAMAMLLRLVAGERLESSHIERATSPRGHREVQA
jgi:DNA-binding LacI/PurR family transcriptional regulator